MHPKILTRERHAPFQAIGKERDQARALGDGAVEECIRTLARALIGRGRIVPLPFFAVETARVGHVPATEQRKDVRQAEQAFGAVPEGAAASLAVTAQLFKEEETADRTAEGAAGKSDASRALAHAEQERVKLAKGDLRAAHGAFVTRDGDAFARGDEVGIEVALYVHVSLALPARFRGGKALHQAVDEGMKESVRGIMADVARDIGKCLRRRTRQKRLVKALKDGKDVTAVHEPTEVLSLSAAHAEEI